MWEEILKVSSVYFSCMLKFIFGPILGYSAQLNLVTTILTTVFGMMTVVMVLTYSGDLFRERVIKKFFKKKDQPGSPKWYTNVWKKYGLIGIAALTPIVLTPIGGTLIAVSAGSPKDKIIFYMFISASFWSFVLSEAVYLLGKEVLERYIIM